MRFDGGGRGGEKGEEERKGGDVVAVLSGCMPRSPLYFLHNHGIKLRARRDLTVGQGQDGPLGAR